MQGDDYKAQCAQLMDMVKKANQNTEALLAVLQKQSSEMDALLKERSAQKSGSSAQWEYGIYYPRANRFTYDGKTEHWGFGDSADVAFCDLGRQGWEAYSTYCQYDDVRWIFMKRKIQ